jgi:acetyl esterase/lipase
MRTTRCPASDRDLQQISHILTDVRGAADTGAAIMARSAPPPVEHSSREWRHGSVGGEVVATPGADDTYGVLYLHGRRFQYEEPSDVYATRLAAATGLPVFEHRYRLAPRYPYPAALNDVVHAYDAILDEGRSAERIVLVGHSAGATLALSALQRLRAEGRPMPAAAVALSPVTDFTYAGDSLASNKNRDIISVEDLHQVRSAYLGDAEPSGPASPLFGDCAGLPPLLIACGDAEMLRDDALRFAARAANAGVRVEVLRYEGMPHTFPVMRLDAAQDLLRRIADFAAKHLNHRSTSFGG